MTATTVTTLMPTTTTLTVPTPMADTTTVAVPVTASVTTAVDADADGNPDDYHADWHLWLDQPAYGVSFATSSPFIPAPSDPRPQQPSLDHWLPDEYSLVAPGNKQFRDQHAPKLLKNENIVKFTNKFRPK